MTTTNLGLVLEWFMVAS